LLVNRADGIDRVSPVCRCWAVQMRESSCLFKLPISELLPDFDDPISRARIQKPILNVRFKAIYIIIVSLFYNLLPLKRLVRW
jgi:hypothetical protein